MRKQITLLQLSLGFSILFLFSCSRSTPVRKISQQSSFTIRIAGLKDMAEIGGLYSIRPRIPKGHGLKSMTLYINGKKVGTRSGNPWFFEKDFLKYKNGTKLQFRLDGVSPKGAKASCTVTVVIRNIDFRIIVRVPENTPQDESVYIAGNRRELGMKSTGEWDPRIVKMRRIGRNLWEKTIKVGGHAALEYEFTRSSWATKGKKKSGSVLHCTTRVAGRTSIRHTVHNWGQITGTSGPKGPAVHFGSRSDRVMRIFWETKTKNATIVHWGLAEKKLIRKSGSGKVEKRHTVRLAGLKPGTKYFYTVPGRTGVGSFTTALSSGSRTPFTFATVGDFQGGNRVIGSVQKENGLSFVLHTGDMVNSGYSHSNWNQYFGFIRSLARILPFMTVPGNHEDESPLYALFHPQPGKRSYYTFDYGCVRFYMINSERDFSPGSVQYRWLLSALRRGVADRRILWRFAVFHTPAFSTGKHLSDKMIQKHLVSLFQRYGIDFALSGHDHAYQITKPIVNGRINAKGITYIVSGGAGATLSGFKKKAVWIKWRKKMHHYCLYRVHPDRIEHIVRFSAGKTLYRTVFRKR